MLWVATMAHNWIQPEQPWGWIYFSIGIPLALALLWNVHRWRRGFDQYDDGYCSYCGYDLRASEDRCPECGCAIKRANESVQPPEPR